MDDPTTAIAKATEATANAAGKARSILYTTLAAISAGSLPMFRPISLAFSAARGCMSDTYGSAPGCERGQTNFCASGTCKR